MNEKFKDDTLMHIKNGTMLGEPAFVLHSIMKVSDMELYSEMCEQRIVDEVGIDGKDIYLNNSDLSLCLTLWGIRRSVKILECYLNDDQIDTLLAVAANESKMTVLKNNILWLLRNYSKEELFELSCRHDEEQEGVFGDADIFRAELESRRVGNRLSTTMNHCVNGIKERVSNQGKIRLFKNIAKDIRDNMSRVEWLKSLDREELIFRNYAKYMNIPIDKMQKDDIKKYVLYGVRVFKESRRRGTVKSCYQIESDYKAMSKIIQAASLLTPNEIMNIFPVDKEYDGDRYQVKDYFYTMNAVRKLPGDQPLGENITYFFENYYSRYAFRFWVNWFMCIGEYDTYCDRPEPMNNYWQRLGVR